MGITSARRLVYPPEEMLQQGQGREDLYVLPGRRKQPSRVLLKPEHSSSSTHVPAVLTHCAPQHCTLHPGCAGLLPHPNQPSMAMAVARPVPKRHQQKA